MVSYLRSYGKGGLVVRSESFHHVALQVEGTKRHHGANLGLESLKPRHGLVRLRKALVDLDAGVLEMADHFIHFDAGVTSLLRDRDRHDGGRMGATQRSEGLQHGLHLLLRG